MVKTKKKSIKSRKTSKNNRRSFTRIIAYGILRAVRFIIIFLAKIIRKNPLAFIGFCLFLCFFAFLTYHVAFNQKKINRSFFFMHTPNSQAPMQSENLTIEAILQNNDSNTIDSEQQYTFINPTPSLKAVPKEKPNQSSINNALNTTILSQEKAQIMRVQAALRSFGNNNVMVNGINDKATQQAIRSFQKMFIIKQTGLIDHELLNKMHEIGLIEK